MKTTTLRRLRNVIVLLAIIVAVALAAGYTMGLFRQEMPRHAVRLENKTDKEFTHMGLAWQDKVLLHHVTATEPLRQAVFPGELLENTESLRPVGITAAGQVWLGSPVRMPENRRIDFDKAAPVTEEAAQALTDLPALSGLSLGTKGPHAEMAFQVATSLHYRIYLLGRGSSLSASDWGTAGEPVQTSWEKGSGSPQGWLLLKSD